jgi:hypothetical protein
MANKAILPLIILSLAALACTPDGDGSSSSGDAFAADASDLLLGSPCSSDTQCARWLVCDDGACAVRECSIPGQCGNGPVSTRGCYKRTGRCTAYECDVGERDSCAIRGLTGECDGRVCQD